MQRRQAALGIFGEAQSGRDSRRLPRSLAWLLGSPGSLRCQQRVSPPAPVSDRRIVAGRQMAKSQGCGTLAESDHRDNVPQAPSRVHLIRWSQSPRWARSLPLYCGRQDEEARYTRRGQWECCIRRMGFGFPRSRTLHGLIGRRAPLRSSWHGADEKVVRCFSQRRADD